MSLRGNVTLALECQAPKFSFESRNERFSHDFLLRIDVFVVKAKDEGLRAPVMSDKKCCVPGCASTQGLDILHGFPNPEKDTERFNAWLMAIGGDILGLHNNHIHKYRRVCHIHFAAKYHCRNNRISNVAIPTLNLPGPLSLPQFSFSERRPMRDIQNFEPSSSKVVPQPRIFGECPSLKELDIKTCISEEPTPQGEDMQLSETTPPGNNTEAMPSKGPEMPSDRRIIVEEMDVVPSSSDLQQIEKSSSKKHEPTPQGEDMQLSETTPPGNNKEAVLRKGGKRTLKKCLPPLTSKENALKMKIVSLQIKVSKLKNRGKKQVAELKAARNLTQNPNVLKVLESCPSTAKLFFEMQWRECKKKQKGRRFTLKEKIVALSILKQSPKAYRFFRKIFVLPAPQTLTKLVQKANIQAGINKNIFQQLKTKTAAMKDQDKLCVLLFDEVSLKPNLTYNERKDRVIGFVNDGHETKPEFANHAQVFMVRGLTKNYKQPVAYTFSASATKGPELAKQIKNVITEVQKSGLIVVATVCDQGTNNRQALKLLVSEARGIQLRRGERPNHNTILINDQEIVPLYDSPHLLKGIRNNLITKNLRYTKDGITRVAKWSHLKRLYEECPGYKGIKLIPKLSGNHVYPEKMNKMKVKYASQVFSSTIASTMGYLADKGILQAESKDTADLLLLMDNLFDSVNGSATKNIHAKPLLGPATPNSIHAKLWRESKQVLASMQFITATGKKESVPTINNWIWTIEGMEVLLKNLRNKFGVTSVWLRHLNQDPLENFFGAIRSHGGRNVNPTCEQFESAYVALIINNLSTVHSHGKNCEEDFTRALHALVIDNNSKSRPPCTIEIGDIININLTPLPEKEAIASVIAPLQYVSGYMLKKTKSNIFKNCAVCKEDFISTDTNADDVEYIKYREYAGQRWLHYPSRKFLIFISNLQDITSHVLTGQLNIKDLKETIKTAMYTWLDFNWINCESHKTGVIEYITNFYARFMIFTHCKNINKILYGRGQVEDEQDVFQQKARKLHLSSRKYKK